VVVLQLISTLCGNGVKLVVGQVLETTTCSTQGIVELVVRIIHLIDTEDGFQAAFVKWFVVSYEWKSFNQWFNLPPYLGEYGGFLSILTAQAMYLTAPVVIIVGLWLDE
jgi:hypothetical protein